MPADPAQAQIEQQAMELAAIIVPLAHACCDFHREGAAALQPCGHYQDAFNQAVPLIARALTDARRAVWEEAVTTAKRAIEDAPGDANIWEVVVTALRQRAAAEEGETP